MGEDVQIRQQVIGRAPVDDGSRRRVKVDDRELEGLVQHVEDLDIILLAIARVIAGLAVDLPRILI